MTPLIQIDKILAKLECTHPTGSIKDRIAEYIIDESEKKGLLKKGDTIIEATSGNTGIAFSYYGKQKGYNVKIVMPKDMSDERKEIIRSLGAELILCDKGNFAKATEIRDKLAKENNYFNPDQFSNPLNVECHYKKTGQQIIEQAKHYLRHNNLPDSIDAFVAGVGTGGTLIGIAKALKEVYPNIYIVAVEPRESPVMNGGKKGVHYIQGIGDGFIPYIAQGNGKNGLHRLIDEVIGIKSDDAKNAALKLSKKGYCVGISSGANYLAAKQLIEEYNSVVTVFPDGFSKYKSIGLKKMHTGKCPCEK